MFYVFNSLSSGNSEVSVDGLSSLLQQLSYAVTDQKTEHRELNKLVWIRLNAAFKLKLWSKASRKPNRLTTDAISFSHRL